MSNTKHLSIPDYTLKQAIGLLELNTHHLWEHQWGCSVCCVLDESTASWCEDGKFIERARWKWKRRIKRTASREGVKMTI